MKVEKIWIRKNGPAEVLSFETTHDGTLEQLLPDEVLIDVYYSGINFADIVMRLGFYPNAPAKPYVPGYEYSGIVLKVGSHVKHVKVGDAVYGGSFFGSHSSKIKIESWLVIKLPKELTLEEGAALPVAFITTHAAICDMARVRAQDKVVIDCATGGVGTLALQILQKLGAETTGLTSSESKKALIESYGARALTHAEFAKENKLNHYDFILNSQGGSSIRQYYNYLAPTGRMVCLGISAGIKNGRRDFFAMIKTIITMPKFSVIKMFHDNRGVYGENALKLMEDRTFCEKSLANFTKISEWNLKPHIGEIIKARDVVTAHKMIESRAATGKLLLAWK
ncbi:MAG: zinc-binding dehydrogenase [Bacteriovoracaceae bacterium]